MEYFNTKTNELTLVEDVKGEELVTKKYQFPIYVKGIFTKKAIDLGAELEENEYMVSGDMFDRLANYFVELYGKQFTYEGLVNGIDSRKIVSTFVEMLFSVLQGDSKNE